jgi:hypothetical protein
MDYVDQNLPENLEEERRRLALQIGKTLVADEYLLALQWAEMLLSLEVRTSCPKVLALVIEFILSSIISSIVLTTTVLKNYVTLLRNLCR